MSALTPIHLEACWDRILPTIELLHGDSVEAVRAACESREACVLEAAEGFIVVSVVVQRNGDRELFVWAIAGKGGHFIRTHHDDLCEAARHLECTRLIGRVKNDRVAQLLERCGWKQRHVEYGLEI